MLIEFSVTNFLSFKERQTLSLVASKRDTDIPENIIDVEIPGMSGVRLLRGAVIYGANASGKTNLLNAVRFVMNYVFKSATEKKPGEATGTTPFRLDKETSELPSEFEILFITEGIRFQYGFALDSERITSEWLFSYPEGKPRRLFERSLDPESGQYDWEFGTYFKDDAKLREKTRDNALFVSVGAQFNNRILTQVFEWFSQHFIVGDLSTSGPGLQRDGTVSVLDSAPSLEREFVQAIREADLGIDGVKVERVTLEERLSGEGVPDSMRKAIQEKHPDAKSLDITFVHKTSDGRGVIDFKPDVESAGTMNFFSLLGPWADLKRNERCVFIDEFGSSMHPHLTQFLLRMFARDCAPDHGSQLVITTHDTTLLDSGLFRRDQVWLTEKGPDSSTRLVPLTEYSPRPNEALGKGYLAGRYGGVPYLRQESR